MPGARRKTRTTRQTARTCAGMAGRTPELAASGTLASTDAARVRQVVLAKERLAQDEVGLGRVTVAEEAHHFLLLEVGALVEDERVDVAGPLGGLDRPEALAVLALEDLLGDGTRPRRSHLGVRHAARRGYGQA